MNDEKQNNETFCCCSAWQSLFKTSRKSLDLMLIKKFASEPKKFLSIQVEARWQQWLTSMQTRFPHSGKKFARTLVSSFRVTRSCKSPRKKAIKSFVVSSSFQLLCLSLCGSVCMSVQGILKGEVSLYHWPPVWLVWNQLYDNGQFLFLFVKQTNPNQSNSGQCYKTFYGRNYVATQSKL